MNYLAHLYLSGDDPEIQIGNFIGDFVKGRTPEKEFPLRVAVGIHLHRLIDSYTDSHPVVRESKIRLRPIYRHYSGVLVDIFYDHFLARHWERHHSTDLRLYAESFYQLAKNQESWLPQKARYVLPFMERNDWLTNYSRIEGIEKVLGGMARRTPYPSGMEKASTDLLKYYEAFEQEFFQFMPELIKTCEVGRKQLIEQFGLTDKQTD